MLLNKKQITDMDALVSIIIPAYNCQLTLERAVQSAISQSYGNIEVVIVDDGSTDSTPPLLMILHGKTAEYEFFIKEMDAKQVHAT